MTALEKQRASGAPSRRHLHRGSSTLVLPRLLQLHQIPSPPAHSRLSLSLHFYPAEAHLTDLESTFVAIPWRRVHPIRVCFGSGRATPIVVVPRRPHTGTIFGGTRIKPRSVWIRTSGAWGQPSAVHADRTSTKSVLLDTVHETQPVLPNDSRNRPCRISTHTPTPRPATPTRWFQESLAQSAEAREQVGDTEDAAVSSQCTVAEHSKVQGPKTNKYILRPQHCSTKCGRDKGWGLG